MKKAKMDKAVETSTAAYQVTVADLDVFGPPSLLIPNMRLPDAQLTSNNATKS